MMFVCVYIYIYIYYVEILSCAKLELVWKLILSDWRVDVDSFSSLLKCTNHCSRASLIAQLVKSLPAMQETQVQFLSWEDPLEEEMTTHSSILAWRISWQRNLAGYIQSMGSQELDRTEWQHTRSLFYT